MNTKYARRQRCSLQSTSRVRGRGAAPFSRSHTIRETSTASASTRASASRAFSALSATATRSDVNQKENKRSNNQQRFSTEEGAYDGVRLTHCVGAETGVQSEPVEGVDQAVLLFLNDKTERSSFSNKHR